MKHFTARQWFVIVLMELIILGITAFLVVQFVFGVKDAQSGHHAINGLAIFCMVMAVLIFVGLNILMVVIIKRHMKK